MSDEKDLDRWARLRFAVIGGLLAAPPERGELKGMLLELSQRTWSHPNDGTAIRFGFSTLERWVNDARKAADPVAALRRQRREDAGQTRCLSPAMIQEINTQYARHSGWTILLHHANLVALSDEQRELGVPPSYATVRRYFRTHGYHRVRKPKRQTPGALAAVERLVQEARR